MAEHYGIIEGGDIERMVDLAQGFSRYRNRLPQGNRVGIFTPSGGAGGWMADVCAETGLEVPQLDPATRATIAEHLPSYGSTGNPVDVTAQAIWRVGHARLAEMVARSDTVDSVIVVTSAVNAGLFQGDGERLKTLAEATDKPILFCSYTTPNPATAAAITGAGYPLYTSMPNCGRDDGGDGALPRVSRAFSQTRGGDRQTRAGSCRGGTPFGRCRAGAV